VERDYQAIPNASRRKSEPTIRAFDTGWIMMTCAPPYPIFPRSYQPPGKQPTEHLVETDDSDRDSAA
jgi:hypothetical protein